MRWSDNRGAERFERRDPTTPAEGWKVHGGEREARKCEVPGKVRMFHDGCGLASPGRWDLEKRIWNKDPFWENLRKGSMDIILPHCEVYRAWIECVLSWQQRAKKGAYW